MPWECSTSLNFTYLGNSAAFPAGLYHHPPRQSIPAPDGILRWAESHVPAKSKKKHEREEKQHVQHGQRRRRGGEKRGGRREAQTSNTGKRGSRKPRAKENRNVPGDRQKRTRPKDTTWGRKSASVYDLGRLLGSTYTPAAPTMPSTSYPTPQQSEAKNLHSAHAF